MKVYLHCAIFLLPKKSALHQCTPFNILSSKIRLRHSKLNIQKVCFHVSSQLICTPNLFPGHKYGSDLSPQRVCLLDPLSTIKE